MKLIKLNAIDSTNSFLKELATNSTLENFTVVLSNNQIKGRGQQMNNWVSEPYKNLTISVFVKDFDLEIYQQKYLNFVVCLSVFKVLKDKKIEHLSIKWPNDILAGNKKISGILIENTFKGNKIKNSIIGIGLNVNQEKFPDFLKNASSLKTLTKKDFDLDVLLTDLITKMKDEFKVLTAKNYEKLENDYLNVLYKKNTPTMFKNSKDVLFMGIIRGLSKSGNLLVELENETIKEFGLKEISLA